MHTYDTKRGPEGRRQAKETTNAPAVPGRSDASLQPGFDARSALAALRAATTLGSSTVSRYILQLQQQHGNRCVQRVVALAQSEGIAVQRRQAVTSPYIAPDQKKATPASGIGIPLGTDRNNLQILAKREVGGGQGYDDRLQAIAAARLARADPSAIALGKDGKWHAFETTAGINVEDASANDPRASKELAGVAFKDPEILPPLAGINESRRKVDELNAKLTRLDDLEEQWKKDPKFREDVKGGMDENGNEKTFLQGVAEEKDRTNEELKRARQAHASAVFGVPSSEISFNYRSFDRLPGKVNLTAKSEPGSNSDARHGPVAGQGDGDFKPGMVKAFDIDTKDLDTPERAQGAMFHEAQHSTDYALAQQWVSRYQAETRRLFVGGSGLRPFLDWINDQAKKKPPRLSAAEAELIGDEAANVSATTEARANIRSFLVYFQAGVPDEATRALTNYAKALPPGTVYGSPPNGSPVLAELTQELKKAYRQASKVQKPQFDAAMAAAKKANSTAWFANVDYSK